MMWPRRKRRKPTPDQMDALRAKVHSELQLKHAHMQHDDAVSVVEKLAQIRERNHFGQGLEWTFGGGKP